MEHKVAIALRKGNRWRVWRTIIFELVAPDVWIARPFFNNDSDRNGFTAAELSAIKEILVALTVEQPDDPIFWMAEQFKEASVLEYEDKWENWRIDLKTLDATWFAKVARICRQRIGIDSDSIEIKDNASWYMFLNGIKDAVSGMLMHGDGQPYSHGYLRANQTASDRFEASR